MNHPPRSVLRVVTRLNVGGPARHALILSKGLAPQYTTTLAVGTPTADEGELTDPAVPLVRTPLVRPVSPRDDVRALAAIRRLIRRGRPRIVHTHMAKAGTVGRLAASTVSHRPRTVHTFHGHVLEGYFAPAVARAFVQAERLLARRTDVIVAVSDEIRDELLDLRIGRPSQYRVIPLGLDLSGFYDDTVAPGALRARLGLAPDVPLLGAVGRLVPIKDVATLLQAMTLLPDVHLAVVGDGELRSALEQQAKDLGLAGRVHFTGWITDVAAVYRDIDVAVLSSRNEGTPVALIEAGASGRPSVATDVGGVRAVVEDGVTGYLVPPAETEVLARRVEALLGDPQLRRRMGMAGRERVRHRFGHERLLDDVRALYDELLA